MEDVIKKIIRIEEKAQTIIEGANKEKEQMEAAFEEKLDALERRVIGDAKRKVRELRERELSDNIAAREAQVDKCNRKLAEMELRVKENRDKWVDELVDNVLKR